MVTLAYGHVISHPCMFDVRTSYPYIMKVDSLHDLLPARLFFTIEGNIALFALQGGDTAHHFTLCYKFSSNVWMKGMTESEPTLSSACCSGPGPYRPIGQLRVIGNFESKI